VVDFTKKFLWFFADIAETIVIAIAVFLLVWVFLVQAFRVQGSSMIPNFRDGEMILTDKISYRFTQPKRGQVIIFQSPIGEKDLIKRVTGLPGETLTLKNGEIFINGKKLEEKYLPADVKTFPGQFIKEDQPITIGSNQFIVFGDNRPHSQDSREWGTVDKKQIVGRAWLIYWPIANISFVPSASY